MNGASFYGALNIVIALVDHEEHCQLTNRKPFILCATMMPLPSSSSSSPNSQDWVFTQCSNSKAEMTPNSPILAICVGTQTNVEQWEMIGQRPITPKQSCHIIDMAVYGIS